jgi:hypothetical protein
VADEDVGMFCALAAKENCVAPRAPGHAARRRLNLSEKTVWIESTITSAGLQPGDLLEDALDAGFGQE